MNIKFPPKTKSISNLPKIEKVEFWAREKSMPLFWLVDERHDLGSSTLIFFRKKMFHLYYLNDSQKENEKIGYNFFSKNKNILLYEKQVEDITRNIKDIFDKYHKYNFGKFSEDEIVDLFSLLYTKLIDFSDLYRMTEASNMDLLKDNKDLDFNKLGNIRLEMRKNFSNLFYIFVGKLLSEIAKRRNVKLTNDIFFYDSKEIINLVRKKKTVSEEKLKERRKGFVVFRKKALSRIFPKKDADKLWKEVHDIIIPKNRDKIIGSPTFKGCIKGRVKIISQSHSKKVSESGYGLKKGDVLVADMTKPDMIIACKKASAIVTDEGGITCHAAIISRELKTPCIVGTKIATQVLKDGDLVEVDANEGVVRILRRPRK